MKVIILIQHSVVFVGGHLPSCQVARLDRLVEVPGQRLVVLPVETGESQVEGFLQIELLH